MAINLDGDRSGVGVDGLWGAHDAELRVFEVGGERKKTRKSTKRAAQLAGGEADAGFVGLCAFAIREKITGFREAETRRRGVVRGRTGKRKAVVLECMGEGGFWPILFFRQRIGRNIV